MIKKIKHKFGAKRTEFNGKKYSSKLEASYAKKLESAKTSGDLLFYLEQVPFSLPGNIKYRLDFMEFWSPKDGQPGDVIFTEIKGFKTVLGEVKLKQVSEIYGIEINVVRK